MSQSAAKHPLTVGKVSGKIENIRLPVGLNVDEVHIDGGAISWSTKTSELPTLGEPARFTVIVKARSIEQFLESLRPGGLHSFRVEIADGSIVAAAIMTVIVPIPAKAVVQLQIEREKRLMIHLVSAEALGAGVRNLVQNQLAQLNPIFDAADLPVNVVFESVSHEAGQVRIEGRVTL